MHTLFWSCIIGATFLTLLDMACRAIERWVVIPDLPEDEIGY